jgi:hypothetical protein
MKAMRIPPRAMYSGSEHHLNSIAPRFLYEAIYKIHGQPALQAHGKAGA